MKNKLTQLYVFVSKIDQRYLYIAFAIAAFFMQSPSDGGGGTRPS